MVGNTECYCKRNLTNISKMWTIQFLKLVYGLNRSPLQYQLGRSCRKARAANLRGLFIYMRTTIKATKNHTTAFMIMPIPSIP